MIGEINLYGVLFPPLLLWLGIALLVAALLRVILNRLAVYRYVWHRPLFDLAILVIILGGVSAIANKLL